MRRMFERECMCKYFYEIAFSIGIRDLVGIKKHEHEKEGKSKVIIKKRFEKNY